MQVRYRYSIILLRELVITDFKLRYQGSVLGYLWSILKPLALFVILYFVFVQFLKIGNNIEHFPIYLLFGIVLWNYFAEVTNGSVSAIVGQGDIIRKINFPKYVIVLAGSFSALINLAINLLVVAVFMIIFGANPSPEAFVLLPLLIMQMFIFSLAMAFLLSALFVVFRDINHIWEVVMQGAFYATPILYPLDIIPAKAAEILLLNPMAQIIQDAREVLITPQAITISELYGSGFIRLVPLGLTTIAALMAVYYFKKRSRDFAENV